MRKGAHGSQRSDRIEQSRTVGKRTTNAQRTVAAVSFPLLGLQLEPQAEHRSDLPTQGHGLDARPLAQMGVGVLHAATTCTEHEEEGGSNNGGVNLCTCLYAAVCVSVRTWARLLGPDLPRGSFGRCPRGGVSLCAYVCVLL